MAAPAPSRHLVFNAYREVLRAINVAFQGDAMAHKSAVDLARKSFREEPKPVQQVRRRGRADTPAEGPLDHAFAVAKILRENVVQGTADSADPSRFKLRIHEQTERGDNESIKKADVTPLSGTAKSFKQHPA